LSLIDPELLLLHQVFDALVWKHVTTLLQRFCTFTSSCQ